jgi:hypothetical protein
MPDWKPMGEDDYNYLLTAVLLLPFDARDVATLGEIELGRYRALEALLKDPALAHPDPSRAAHVPTDPAEFLAAYEARQAEIVDVPQAAPARDDAGLHGRVPHPPAPEAFKPTSPGGFMNPPGLYDQDPVGFFYIPTYNPKSGNFYIRAAIEDPRRSSARRHSRPFPADLDRESPRQRDPAPARRLGVRRRVGAV